VKSTQVDNLFTTNIYFIICDGTREKGPLDVKMDFEIKALDVRFFFFFFFRKSEYLFFSLHSDLILSSRLVIKRASLLVKDS